MTKLSLSKMLISFHVYVCFPLFLLVFRTSLSPVKVEWNDFLEEEGNQWESDVEQEGN